MIWGYPYFWKHPYKKVENLVPTQNSKAWIWTLCIFPIILPVLPISKTFPIASTFNDITPTTSGASGLLPGCVWPLNCCLNLLMSIEQVNRDWMLSLRSCVSQRFTKCRLELSWNSLMASLKKGLPFTENQIIGILGTVCQVHDHWIRVDLLRSTHR